MSNYEDQFWGGGTLNSYDTYTQNASNLEFQSFGDETYDPYGTTQSFGQQPTILNPLTDYNDVGFGTTGPINDDSEYDEPPLLDELEIYPERILEKTLAVLNPYHANGLSNNPDYMFQQTDLAGPIVFCFGLAAALFISGSKANFGYIYGLSMTSVVVMYVLISLMSNSTENYITVSGVASILGYSILPIVWLSVLGIFMSLKTTIGLIMVGASVFLSTSAASRIFCLMTGDPNQRFLIAYPCCLVYVIFTILLLF